MKSRAALATVTVLNLLWWAGCEPTATSVPPASTDGAVTGDRPLEAPVRLQLAFTPGRLTRYRLTREYRKQVAWQGVPEERAAALQDGASATLLQLGFTQTVERFDAATGADLSVTVTDLAYRQQFKDRVQIDFDSRRETDADQPFRQLVGRVYGITLSPEGKVVAVSGLEAAGQALPADTPAGRLARRLFSETLVRERHTVTALAGRRQAEARPGDTWQVSTVEDFQEMGQEAFHKLYTLEACEDQGEARRAVITLEAEPSARGVTRESNHPFAGMVDSERDFSGRWELDLHHGEVVTAREALTMTWRVVVPAGGDAAGRTPVRSTMQAQRRYSLERQGDPG
jgi:hypothetical protein